MTGKPSSPWTKSPNGLLLTLRVTPNASRNAIESVEPLADGRPVLRVRITAIPDKGKANAAMIALLAKKLGVPKSAIALKSGTTARLKTIEIAGDATQIADKIATLTTKSP